MGGKNPTTTTTQSTSPDPNAYNAYLNVLGQAQGIGSSTYQPYTGQLTAPVNQQQTTGIQGVNNYANSALPIYQGAIGQATSSSAPLSQAAINQYMSPYTQQVINATQNQFNQTNAQQDQNLIGNTISQNALGGNRSAIGLAELTGQQNLSEAPTIAGLGNTGYNQAVQVAMQQQNLGLQGANTIGNLGAGMQNTGTAGANAQINAGNLLQTTTQAQLNTAYQQYLNAQAYPYQQLSWLAGVDTGVGSNMGGTGNGTTVGPSPNVFGQIIGAGAAAAGLYNMSDRRVKENIQSIGKLHNGMTIYRFNFKGDPKTQIGLMAQDVRKDHPEAVKSINGILHVDHKRATDDSVRRALGGVVPHFDSGGGVAPIPYGGMANSIFPNQAIVHGSGPPHVSPPGQPSQQQSQNQEAQNLGSLAKSIMSATQPGGGDPGTAVAGDIGPSSYGGINGPTPLVGMATGGGVRGYDDGGGVAPASFDDRWSGLYGDQAPPDDPAGAPYFIDADASQRWRDGVDRDLNRGQTMQALNAPAPIPPEVAPTAVAARGVVPSSSQALAFSNDAGSNTTALPDIIAYGKDSNSPPQAAGLAPAPSAPPTSGQDTASAPPAPGLDTSSMSSRFGPDSKLWPALVSAGFGMMASRSPYLGNMIGEGGQAAIGSYNKQSEQERAEKLEQQKMAFEREKFNRPYSELTADQKAILARQKAQDAFTQANQPVTIDPKTGQPIVNSVYTAASEANRTDKWTPIGSVVSDGTTHPLLQNSVTGEVKDAVTGKPPNAGDKISTGKSDPAIIQNIAEGIKSGRQPPVLTGLYGQSSAVRSKLEEGGFDLAKAQIEWDRAKKQVATLNGPQMTRFVGLAQSVDQTIDEVRNLSKQMDNSGIPKLNAAKLALYLQAEGNSENGKLAARYVGAVNTLKEEFANLANGGYAPTEPAWKLANEQINGNYGVGELGSSLDEVQRLIKYRINAIPGLDTLGPGAGNRYTGQAGGSPASAPAQPSAAAALPAGIPPGSQYSPSRKQYRDPQGRLYDANGRPL